MPHPQRAPRRGAAARTAARLLLGGSLLCAGCTHLTVARRAFRAQVPETLPLPDDEVVVGSGFVELALGGALVALPRHQTALGRVAAAYFVAIFPGNIAQYLNRTDAFGLDSDQARALRLLLQPALVAWALWSTGTGPAGAARSCAAPARRGATRREYALRLNWPRRRAPSVPRPRRRIPRS
jgi:uncharacterized membrane protein